MRLTAPTIRPFTIAPMNPAAEHALAAAWAFGRARHLIENGMTPVDPAAAIDVPGVRQALQEAENQLAQANIALTGHRPGTGLPANPTKGAAEILGAWAQAREGIAHLTTPGVIPPTKALLEHITAGADMARHAVGILEGGFGTIPTPEKPIII